MVKAGHCLFDGKLSPPHSAPAACSSVAKASGRWGRHGTSQMEKIGKGGVLSAAVAVIRPAAAAGGGSRRLGLDGLRIKPGMEGFQEGWRGDGVCRCAGVWWICLLITHLRVHLDDRIRSLFQACRQTGHGD